MLLYWEILSSILNIKNEQDATKVAQILRIAGVNSEINIDQELKLRRELLKRYGYLLKAKMVL